MPPTGKRVEMAGLTVFRIAKGKLVEGWNHPDLLSLLQQIDAMPAPAEISGRRRTRGGCRSHPSATIKIRRSQIRFILGNEASMSARTNHPGTNAIIIGARMGGLLAASTLADHFDHVTLLE